MYQFRQVYSSHPCAFLLTRLSQVRRDSSAEREWLFLRLQNSRDRRSARRSARLACPGELAGRKSKGRRSDGRRWGVSAHSADRALVNGAAPASPPSASIANAGAPRACLRPSHVHVFLLCSVHAWRGCPLLLPLRRRPDRLSTLHAKGLLSPRPARRQIRRGNPDDGAPRPSRRRLRHLGHPPPRSPALRRLLRRPRLSRPAPGQAHRGHAAPPPRQRAAAANGAPPRRRAPPPLPEHRTAARPPRASRTQPPAPRPRPPQPPHRHR